MSETENRLKELEKNRVRDREFIEDIFRMIAKIK